VATSLSRDRVSSNGSTSNGSVGITPAVRKHRSLPLAVVAIACMVVSILAFVGFQLAASDSVPVLAVARPVSAGTVISEGDLRVVQVSPDPGLSTVGLSDRDQIVGRTAAVDLLEGSLLTSSAVGEPAVISAGEALVGVEVAAAAAPLGAIRVGDTVRVIEVEPAEGTNGGSGTVIADGRVLRVSAGGSSAAATTQLSLVVPEDKAPDVASASLAQRAAVVVVP
jgi:flagella basal body P-ring formation protein FlgA